MLHLWYILGLNVLFGIAVHIYIHVVRFSEPGKSCADVQTYRAAFLLCDVIVFWTTFVIMSFPQLIFCILGKANLEDASMNKAEEDEEGDGDKKD